MNDTDILQHLLEVEGQAATLVDDAQAKADMRIKEAEEQNRLYFEESYKQITAEKEADYQKAAVYVKAEYEKLLNEFRAELDQIPRHNEAFSALAFSLLLDNKCILNQASDNERRFPSC